MKNKFVLATFILILFSCTTDRDFDVIDIIVPEDPTSQLVHYWNFNDISSLEIDLMM